MYLCTAENERKYNTPSIGGVTEGARQMPKRRDCVARATTFLTAFYYYLPSVCRAGAGWIANAPPFPTRSVVDSLHLEGKAWNIRDARETNTQGPK